MNAIHRAKERYLKNKHDACRQATENLRGVIGVDFKIVDFSRATLDAIEDQWGGASFDWGEINRRYREPGCIKIAIWVGEQLCAVALGNTSGGAIKFHYLEGNPSDSCPLKGKRILIALEVMALYGQFRGKAFLDLEPINEQLVSLYQETYGFEVVEQRKGPTICRKGI